MNDDLTPPELRDLVDDTVELLKRRAGVMDRPRHPLTNEEVERRLRMIRRRAQSTSNRGRT